MQPKLIKVQKTEYVQGVFTGTNECGFKPFGDKVLVLTDQAAGMTSGGVHIDPASTERMTLAAETGVLIDVGSDAFAWNSDRTRRLETTETPKAGDRVYIERYAGQVIMGKDGQFYRLMDDKCIGAVEIVSDDPA